MRPYPHLASALALPAALAAQAPSAPAPAAAEQIAAAVTPLPPALRASATVMGYGAGGALGVLRRGDGPMTCLADDPAAAGFHAACYHRDLEPFMARGRALRAEGVRGPAVDSARFREVRAGRLAVPRTGGALYSLTSQTGAYDAATGRVPGARPLFVYYLPNATGATTGLPEQPGGAGQPWLMFPGTPKAHVMLVGTMEGPGGA